MRHIDNDVYLKVKPPLDRLDDKAIRKFKTKYLMNPKKVLRIQGGG